MVTPAQHRHLRAIAREGGHARVAAAGRTGSTAPLRAGFLRKFELEADPDDTLDPAERRWRAEQLLKQHMARLARKSATARRKSAGR